MDGGTATLLVLGLLSTVSLGYGIRCYVCSSAQDFRCLDPKLLQTADIPNSKPLVTVDCNDTDIVYQMVSLFKLEETYVNSTACLKIVIDFPDGRHVLRGCSPFKEICEPFKLVSDSENSLEYCGICDGDGCNLAAPGGSSLSVSAALPLAVVLASSGWRG